MSGPITPFLWFDGRAEEAATYYTALFPNSSITNVTRYTDAGPLPAGTVMTVEFELCGQAFVALNGGPEFSFTPAISFVINCRTQDEVDRYWSKLGDGGQQIQCGWVTDRFGITWQVVPEVLPELLSGDDMERTQRVMEAMMQMGRLDIAELRRAHEGR